MSPASRDPRTPPEDDPSTDQVLRLILDAAMTEMEIE